MVCEVDFGRDLTEGDLERDLTDGDFVRDLADGDLAALLCFSGALLTDGDFVILVTDRDLTILPTDGELADEVADVLGFFKGEFGMVLVSALVSLSASN